MNIKENKRLKGKENLSQLKAFPHDSAPEECAICWRELTANPGCWESCTTYHHRSHAGMCLGWGRREGGVRRVRSKAKP